MSKRRICEPRELRNWGFSETLWGPLKGEPPDPVLNFGQPDGARGILVFTQLASEVGVLQRKAVRQAWGILQKWLFDNYPPDINLLAAFDSGRKLNKPSELVNSVLCVVHVKGLSTDTQVVEAANLLSLVDVEPVFPSFLLMVVSPAFGNTAAKGQKFLAQQAVSVNMAVQGEMLSVNHGPSIATSDLGF